MEWNKILIDQCERSAIKFKEFIEKYPKIKEGFLKEASFGNEMILVRKIKNENFYHVLDGMQETNKEK